MSTRRRPPATHTRPAQAAAPAPELGPVPDGTPLEQAWAMVARECPDHRSAAEHQSGARVHVVPMQYPNDIRCVPGEPVHGYPGFYRPAGGYVGLHPAGTVLPGPEELAKGAKPPPTVAARKTFTYQHAEMTGR